MFLFLSKLLPLFIYPVGLTCLFLLTSLVLSWRRSRWSPLPVALALVILWGSSTAGFKNRLLADLEWRHLPQGELPAAEAIVVLGGGLLPQESPRPMVEVAEGGDRVLYGAQLYHQDKAPLILVSGGRIAWQGEQVPEAQDMAMLLRRLGVPQRAIVQEARSLNTHENALFSRELLADRDIHRILLITSATHMPRALAVFEKQGFEVIPAPTDFRLTTPMLNAPDQTLAGWLLDQLPDTGNLWSTTVAIKEYIGLWVYRLKGWA